MKDFLIKLGATLAFTLIYCVIACFGSIEVAQFTFMGQVMAYLTTNKQP